MSSPELATSVQYGLPIVVLLVNNGMYATIRMHQERQYPGRVVGTTLENPDFPALARSYGAFAERVERTEDFEAAGRAKLRRKNLDLVVVNRVGGPGTGFEADTNEAMILGGDGADEPLRPWTKQELASAVLDRVAKLLA